MTVTENDTAEVDDGALPVYHGYMADLLDEVSNMLGITYDIFINDLNTYGYRTSDGAWNGMIGDVLAGVSVRRSDQQTIA